MSPGSASRRESNAAFSSQLGWRVAEFSLMTHSSLIAIFPMELAESRFDVADMRGTA